MNNPGQGTQEHNESDVGEDVEQYLFDTIRELLKNKRRAASWGSTTIILRFKQGEVDFAEFINSATKKFRHREPVVAVSNK